MREEEIFGKSTRDSGKAMMRRVPWSVDSFKSFVDLIRTLISRNSEIRFGSIKHIMPDFIGSIIGSKRAREAAKRNPSLTKSGQRKQDRFVSQPPSEDILVDERYVKNSTPNYNAWVDKLARSV